MFRLRILVAENNRPSLNLYRDILSKMGHEVETVRDGEEAWELFCRSAFHAVLVDYRLPGVGGEEFFTRVKQVAPDVDVVLLTGNGSIDKILALVEKGVTDYLVKPVNPHRLREMFEKVAMKQKLLADGSSLADELGELPELEPVETLNEGSPDRGGSDGAVVSGATGRPEIFEELEAAYDGKAGDDGGRLGDTSGFDGAPARDAWGYGELRRRLEAAESRLSEAEYGAARSRELALAIQELQEERDMLRRETERLRAELMAAGRSDELRKELKLAQVKNGELEKRIRRQSEDLEALEEQVQSRTRELEDLEKSRERVKEALERERSRVESKQSEIDSLTRELDELRSEVNRLRDRERHSGEDDIQELYRELEQVRAELARSTGLLDERSSEVENLRGKVESLERDLLESTHIRKELEGQLADLEERMARGDEGGDGDGAGARVKELSAQVELLERRLADLDKSRHKLMESLRKERDRAAAAEEELDRLRAEHGKEMEEFRDTVAVLKDEVSALTAAATAREEAATYLKRKLKARSEKYKALKKAAMALEADNAEYESRLVDLRSRLEEFEQRVREVENERDRLRQELAARNERLEELTRELVKREDELLEVRTEALQSGEEIVRNTENRFKRVIDDLQKEIERLKDVVESKEEALGEARAESARLRDELRRVQEQFSEQKLRLEEELADLREVLADREEILRQGLSEREKEFRALLAQREEELEEARRSGQAEAERLEEELQELRRSQRKRELQDELQSEWMELGEALVLLDEELKSKEAELQELKDDYSRKERAYETTIANQRRKYKELELRFDELRERLDDAVGDVVRDIGQPDGAESGNAVTDVKAASLRPMMTGIEPAFVVVDEDGLMVDFDRSFQDCMGMDDTRRPGLTYMKDVPGTKLVRPLWYRIVQGGEDTIERPVYIRPPSLDPRPYWGIANRFEEDGRTLYRLEFFDVSGRPEVLSHYDFSDARIIFESYDAVYKSTLKITEALFSIRIVVEILMKKFSADIEIKSMVADVLKELDALIAMVEEL